MAAKSKQVDSTLQGYLDDISAYDREFAKWEKRVEKILKRYRDDHQRETNDSARFNILWSNVQVLVPATFARVPQPDVSRRFRDNDPTGRVAALILERGLDFEVQHYPDYRDTMKQCVLDRFLGGRGTAWVRYEPHFKTDPNAQKSEPEDGAQITEDVEAEAPEEQLDYECAPVDYVHWRDFGHSVARTWEEVTRVWRWVYMSESAVNERFGAEIAKKIPYDASPRDNPDRTRDGTEQKKQAKVCELWDKEKGVAVWFSKSLKSILDERDDPLKLQQFFPTPKPLFATLTNESLVPIPDFTLYQYQANQLDVLADRSDGLAKMLQLKGVYDGSADSSLARLFTEGENGTLLPVKNWAAFAEKGGLKGQIDVYDLTPLVKASEAIDSKMEVVKNQVYEIMGISDIVRGASDPNETLGAQELKGQYTSMRTTSMKADVARFATDLLQIKAQIMCSKFNPATLAAIAAVDQLNPADKPLVYQMAPGPVGPNGQPGPSQPVPGPDGKPLAAGPAMALLVGPERLAEPAAESPNPLRSFRIEVNADSMVQMNEQEEKASRMEFLKANGEFMDRASQMAVQAGAAAPIIMPLVMEMWKFGVTGFKVGKAIEGAFDQAADKLKELAANPPPPQPDPKVVAEQGKQALAAQQQQHDAMIAQREQQQSELVAQHEAAMQQAEERRQQLEAAAEHQREMQEQANRAALEQQKQNHDARVAELQDASEERLKKYEIDKNNDTKIIVAKIAAKAVVDKGMADAEQKAEEEFSGQVSPAEVTPKKPKPKPMDVIKGMHKELADKTDGLHKELSDQMKAHGDTIKQIAEDAAAPVEMTRGADGRVETIKKGGRTMRVVRSDKGITIQ